MPSKKRVVIAATAITGLIAIGGAAAIAAIPAPTPQGFAQERSAEIAAQINPAKPKSVILIIGDGMDDSIITAARNYEYGAGGKFPYLDALPFTGAMTTYGLKAGTAPDYPIAYVSDSAPTASGWSTGKKTIDSRVSQGPSTASNVPGTNYETVLEKYQAQGKKVGNITTSELSDATPAAAASHISQRSCQGPADARATCTLETKSAGGLGAITEQLVDHKIDVLMGGGLAQFNETTDAGPTVLSYAQTQKGYRVLQNATDLNAVSSLSGGPVLGVFAPVNMAPRYDDLVATVPPGAGSATTRCVDNPDRATGGLAATQPDLSSMVEKSIQLLDNPNGFFLQAESAMIDKQEHSIDICGAIGDLKELDEAVGVALKYQEAHPDTLIVVTGDHSHSTQIVGDGNGGKYTATIQTADGDPMSVAYSTSTNGSNHTGTQIRVAASGPQAANVTGVIDQTDLFATLLGRTPSTLPTPATPPTPPAPAATPLKPAASVVAGVSKISVKALKKQGLPVAVAASGATTVTVTLVKGSRTLASTTTGATGGTVTLKSKKAAKGSVTVVVTVTGAGGTATSSDSVKVTK